MKPVLSALNKILPNLWLGSEHALTSSILKSRNIGVVFTITPKVYTIPKCVHTHFQVSIYDDVSQNSLMRLIINDITYNVHRSLTEHYNVLIHCEAGIQRSSTVCCAYLMKYHNMSLFESLHYIKMCRPIAFSDQPTFINTLRETEHKSKPFH